MRSLLRTTPLVCALLALVACGDSTGPPEPAELVGLSGGDQTATVGQTLADPLRVRVADANARPLRGVEVVFEATSSGGSLSGGAGEDAIISVAADRDGTAEAEWTLGPLAGQQTATASVEGLPPVEFSATAEPGPPAAVVVGGGDGQLGLPGEALARPLTACVVDEYGNGLAGETVEWQVSAGGGALTTGSSQTDASGAASTELTLGDGLGFNTVSASRDGLTPIDFNALALTTLVADAAEDTFSTGISGNAVLPDILGLGAAWDGDSLLIGLAFRDPVVMAAEGGPNVVTGLLDLDIDMDSLTGIPSAVDEHRPNPGSTGMGVDVIVDLFGNEDGDLVIFDWRPNTLGTTTPDFRARLIGFKVPASLIGNGPLLIAAVVGTVNEPTDIVPEAGSLLMDAAAGAPVAAGVEPAPVRVPLKRTWRPVGAEHCD